jgi:hypothetical protein
MMPETTREQLKPAMDLYLSWQTKEALQILMSIVYEAGRADQVQSDLRTQLENT